MDVDAIVRIVKLYVKISVHSKNKTPVLGEYLTV